MAKYTSEYAQIYYNDNKIIQFNSMNYANIITAPNIFM